MFWIVLQISLLLFLALCLVIAISNVFALHGLDGYPAPSSWPRVSVLVPARNEADNIEHCVQDLCDQNYPDFEVIVLDDNSSDATPEVLARLLREHPRLRVVSGDSIPPGWVGKNWACHQLATHAAGELLLFTDADCRHSRDMLRATVSALLAEQADFLSALPHEECSTWSELLTVPFFTTFGWFGLIPLAVAYRVHLPALSTANGQFLFFRRAAYETIGGFEAIRAHALDDVALARSAVAHRLKWRMFDGTRHTSCRMYHNLREVIEGFSKNALACFDYRILTFILFWSWVKLLFLGPLVVLGFWAAGKPLHSLLGPLALLTVAASLLLWATIYLRLHRPPYLALFYPLTVILAVIIAWRSLVLTLAGRVTWKGRILARHAARIG